MSFTDKVVLISGAGTGIGKEAAHDFLSKGAKVVVNGRRESVLVDAYKDHNGSVRYAPGDISKPETGKENGRHSCARIWRGRHCCKQCWNFLPLRHFLMSQLRVWIAT